MKLKTFGTVLMLSTSLFLISCKSEKELVVDATSFVNQLGGEYSVVKAISMERGYAVLFNKNSNKYMAINLETWKAGSDAAAYLESETQRGRVFFNLRSRSGGDFEDRESGRLFEGSEVSAKDGQSQAGFVEQLNIEAAKENLVGMGISSEKASEIAPILVAKAKKDSLSTEDLNAVLEAVGNTSLSEIADSQSNPLAQQGLIQKAADLHGMSSEQMKEIVSNILE